MKRLSLLIVMVFCAFASSFAQRAITGTVTGPDGSPLIGASVLVKGTSVGTVTDFDGRYALSVPDGQNSIVISYTGYESQELELGASNVINAVLAEGVTLEAAVVTGLGIKKEAKSLGYGYSEVSSEEITQTSNNRTFDALAGRVPGLTISSSGQPGGSSEINLRGYGSVTGNNTALIVVDGIPINNRTNTSATTQVNADDDFNRSQDFGNQANDINPNDIESITVLKGAAATAIYGKRGGTGVILITTKSGKKNQKLRVDYAGSFAGSTVNRVQHMQNTYGQGWSGLWATNENGSWGPKFDNQERLWGNTVDNSRLLKPYSLVEDNLRDFYDPGTALTNSLTLSGGTENLTFRVSYGNAQENGIVPGNKDTYNRNNFSARTEFTADKLTIGAAMEYINKKAEVIATGQGDDAGAGATLAQEIIQIPRDHAIVDYADFNNKFYNQDNYFTPYASNPYLVLDRSGNDYNENRFLPSAWATYQFTNKFSVTGRLGTDFSSANLLDWGNPIRITPGSPNSSANDVVGKITESQTNTEQLDFNLFGQYNTGGGSSAISLDLIGGLNINQRALKYISTYVTDLTIPEFYNLSNSSNPPTSNNASRLERGVGVYASAGLGFNDWLYLTLTARNDWSSTLPLENNSFFYPSASVSAILTEKLIPSGSFLSFLKLRAGYALAGNDTGPYLINPVFVAGEANSGFASIKFPIAGQNGFETGNRLGNPGLKAELTSELEFGFDARFFNNRLGFDFSWYDRVTSDQIIEVQLAPSTGYTRQVTNLGEVENKGIELGVNMIPLKGRNWSWELNVMYTQNDNNVNSLGDTDATRLILNNAYSVNLVAEVGKPLGAVYSAGALYTEDGRPVVDANGLPVSDPEQHYLGSINSDYMLGLGTTLNVGAFSLSANGDYRSGGVMYSYTARLNYFVGNAWNSAYNDREPFIVPNSVTDNGDGTYSENLNPVSRADVFTYWGSILAAEENHVIDRSYFKLRNVSLTYNIPASISNKAKVSNASITAFGRNLALWTPEENNFVDPEGSTFGTGLTGQLGEFGGLPTSASYGLALKLSF